MPDDDFEYVNVTIQVEDYFELKWTLGWNLWSIPMIRSENASLGMDDLTFSWFAEEHFLDTSKVGPGDNAILVAWVGGVYVTYVHPTDAGGAADLEVQPDYGYWAYVEESWFTDEAALGDPEEGIWVPGQFVWRHMDTRMVSLDVGWNLLGWTSFNTTYTGVDVIKFLTTAAASPDGVPQPEMISNWTAVDWHLGAVADMQHYEGAKYYTNYLWLGSYGESLPGYDFPVGPGYGFWVYTEVAGQTLIYNTE